MIPQINNYRFTLEELEIPSNTYKIIYDKHRINGMVNGAKALEQAIYLILSTERYVHPIYSWRYGVELLDVIGLDPMLAIPEIKRKITEALIQDDRILAVDNFQFTINKKKVHAAFVVTTIYGGIDINTEVRI